MTNLHESRDLLAAGLAPGRPEVDHKNLTLPLQKISPLSGKVRNPSLTQNRHLIWFASQPPGKQRTRGGSREAYAQDPEKAAPVRHVWRRRAR